jgi:hypothetical protein
MHEGLQRHSRIASLDFWERRSCGTVGKEGKYRPCGEKKSLGKHGCLLSGVT